MVRVVLATHNAHKAREFQEILGREVPGLEIVAYDGPEPVEDGVSFEENALIKARAAVEHTGLPALADDSGICVDVMGGAPGIFSARWAGLHGDAEANLRLLLDQLADIPDADRGAHFAATLALLVPGGEPTVVQGVWPGRIAHEPRGENGHGYDPIFLPDGREGTAAELAPEAKNAESHRARALAAIVPALRALA
ncbi:RdgB/HAM1 family non-canonical purine NTP pyrophosphatase [Leifsonia sp. fls2-241-R2A-40a]|uniref:RdgB/HAM1 family non-canonical purine NTP pyrophosphatase n=1 Tax=Leifsonia sp. fls2-241-R2A-40a TaxID=3040290 RepID=UPI00254F5B14|nr:RdgB/HAM1 family non-canonical purine NTP pyrophosphatase [Leifsonia sp. fls2-241-R2A-40a]